MNKVKIEFENKNHICFKECIYQTVYFCDILIGERYFEFLSLL